MNDPFDLERFKRAQAAATGGFADARRELLAGQKTSHWIWYVLPQLRRPGTSAMSQTYGLADRAEANAYLGDPVLGPRLAELIGIVARHLAAEADLVTLMGSSTDALKITSCVTLFAPLAEELGAAASTAFNVGAFARDCRAVLAAAERQGFPPCAFTRERLGG